MDCARENQIFSSNQSNKRMDNNSNLLTYSCFPTLSLSLLPYARQRTATEGGFLLSSTRSPQPHPSSSKFQNTEIHMHTHTHYYRQKLILFPINALTIWWAFLYLKFFYEKKKSEKYSELKISCYNKNTSSHN